jgi:DNA-binding transcriptional ArsR family regulator
MVNNVASQLDGVFGALSDSTRRAIIERLARGEVTVTELAAPFPSSLPAISKHLRVLESAGLIARRTVGRQRFCTLETSALSDASAWIDYYRNFWNERLDALEDFLLSDSDKENKE